MARFSPCSVLILLMCTISVRGWISPPVTARLGLTAMRMVDSIRLDSIEGNHEVVGTELAGSLQRMLDSEWMPQEVHEQVADQVKAIYIECRQGGEDDLMAIMTATADKLMANWKDYDKDMFVGAWDISNYVSDWLTAKSGVEGCECNSRIY